MALRIYLVDDNLTFLTALHRFLTQLPDVEVTGQSLRGADALWHIEQLKPDLILLDLDLPDMTGLAVGAALKRWRQPPYIIILSMHDIPGYAASVDKLGALAIVNKQDLVHELPRLLPPLTQLQPRGTCK